MLMVVSVFRTINSSLKAFLLQAYLSESAIVIPTEYY
jgi:hypothetical protein